MPNALLLELNEVNFDAVRDYVDAGKLPEFERLLACGVTETTSESSYEHLEPWIQWVTAHTGLTFEQHGVFRLGDIVNHDIDQIWEDLEARGIRVGAVSPMNAKNRTKDAAFFVPDPWTNTRVTGSLITRKLYDAIAQAVNDNASSRIGFSSLFWLLVGAIRFARPVNFLTYFQLVLHSRRKGWNRALFLDLLLSDVFIRLARKTNPGFCSLFLNAGAHIQHHYMFSSSVYRGEQVNPDWYVAENEDPVFDVYSLYDRIIGQVRRACPGFRLMVATGLHQDPHPETTYYWRLTDHESFLNQHSIPFDSVEPRMSRDFLIRCKSRDEAAAAESTLARFCGRDGTLLFEIDNRGSDLFVMLTYPNDIGPDFVYSDGDSEHEGLRAQVAFVAIKNGQHNGVGYFVDCDAEADSSVDRMPLSSLPELIRSAVLAS